MSERSVRCSGVLATLLLVGALAACGGGDSDLPEATASPPASVDADGYTADQRAVIDRVEEFVDAVYGRGTTPVAETSRGLVTDQYGAELIKTSRAQVEDAGKKWLGPYAFEPSEVEVKADTASVGGCLDLTAMFLVPRDDTAAGPGSTNIGKVLPASYRLEKVADTWLVDGFDEPEATC